MKTWLDSSGHLLYGKHKGELAEDVARSDRGYVRWLIDEVEDMSEEDREILSAQLSFVERRSR